MADILFLVYCKPPLLAAVTRLHIDLIHCLVKVLDIPPLFCQQETYGL
jgi:hypothetical protein